MKGSIVKRTGARGVRYAAVWWAGAPSSGNADFFVARMPRSI